MVGQGQGSLSHLKLVKGLCLTRLTWRVTCRTIVPNEPLGGILPLNKGLWGINSWRKQQPSRVLISQILTWITHVSDLVPQETIQWIHEFFCKLLFSVLFLISVYMCKVCLSVFLSIEETGMSLYVCEGQRTTLGASDHLLSCMRQGLLFTTAYPRLAHQWSSGSSIAISHSQ